MAVLRVKDENGNLIEIHAIRGEKGESGETGPAGYTPAKGVDYYTETDKAEMIADVIALLPVYNGEVVAE